MTSPAPENLAARPGPPGWRCAVALDRERRVVEGSFASFSEAIGRGADLRVYTEFYYEEHIAPFMPSGGADANRGLIGEVIDFRETVLVDGRHAAGITTLRQPLNPPHGFNGPEPKLSLFLYNMDGLQCCANVALGPTAGMAPPGTRRIEPPPVGVPKMSAQEVFDAGTSGPSRNFVYDMEVYRFLVRDDWEEVLAHEPDGRVTRGSWAALSDAQRSGREIKVGLRGLCADLAESPALAPPHEVFSHVGSSFCHHAPRLLDTLTHPLVRVAPAIPLRYASFNWDVSWVWVRTDGAAIRRTLNPYTRAFEDRDLRLAMRWFAR